MREGYTVERGGRSVLNGGLFEEAHSRGFRSIETGLLQIPGEERHDGGRYPGHGRGRRRGKGGLPLARKHQLPGGSDGGRGREWHPEVRVGKWREGYGACARGDFGVDREPQQESGLMSKRGVWTAYPDGEAVHEADMSGCCHREARNAEGNFDCFSCGAVWQAAFMAGPEECAFAGRPGGYRRKRAA